MAQVRRRLSPTWSEVDWLVPTDQNRFPPPEFGIIQVRTSHLVRSPGRDFFIGDDDERKPGGKAKKGKDAAKNHAAEVARAEHRR